MKSYLDELNLLLMVDFRDMIDILVHFVYTGGRDFLVIQFFFSILTMSDILLTLMCITLVDGYFGLKKKKIYKLQYMYVQTKKLLNHWFLWAKLMSSLRKFYTRHHDCVDRYEISVSQIIMDMFHLS